MLLVVAAALIKDGHVLLMQRPKTKSWSGYWELPGGKIETGETPEQALIRELQEELCITAQDPAPLTFKSHAYDDFHLLMPIYKVTQWQGNPDPQEGYVSEWADINALGDYKLLPADQDLVELLPKLMRL